MKGLSRAVAVLVCLAAGAALASSHREAPLIANDPPADATDLYAWRHDVGGTPNVVLVANYSPLEAPDGGPNFYAFGDHVLYEIKVDNDGDGVADVTYQFRFQTTLKKSPLQVPPASPGDSFLIAFAPVAAASSSTGSYGNLLQQQTYSVTRVNKDGTTTVMGSGIAVPPDNIGTLTTPGYSALAQAAVHDLGGGRTVFAGQRDDPFFVNLHQTFDFLNYPADGKDDLAGFNVLSIVLEVPATDLFPAGSPALTPNACTGVANCPYRLGIWTTASRQKVRVKRADGTEDGHGPWVQVSRLGNPLINEVIVPLKFKNFFNGSQPKDDLAHFGAVVLDPELPYLLQAKGFIPKVPPAPRTDLVAALAAEKLDASGKPTGVAETLHLDVSVVPTDGTGSYSILGALGGDPAGFPNGRRLADDVTDIALQVVGGAAYQLFGAQDAGDATDYATPASGLSDGVSANDVAFQSVFPFEADPHPGDL
jgi:hypothetical protein